MNRFFIIANQRKEPACRAAEQIKKYLEERGGICYVQDEAAGPGNGLYKYTNPRQIPEDVQCVLVLGGDGTLLQASRDLMDRRLPLLGINLGTLGYLAEIELSSVWEALDRLMAGNFDIEERMMLSGVIWRGEQKVLEDIALNDIVVCRRGPMKVIDFTIYVNDTLLCSYRADGIIVSTPTGSTGYSLSTGGPIVSPDAFLMLLTAIAPHTLSFRPVVLPDKVQITVVPGGNRRQGEVAEATFDGDTVFRMEIGDRITIRRARQQTRLVKIHNTSFVEILRKKMN